MTLITSKIGESPLSLQSITRFLVSGSKCDNNKKMVVIDFALYGQKTRGQGWQDFSIGTLCDKGYVPCKADKNVFVKAKTRKKDERYCSHILVYVMIFLLWTNIP